MGYSEKKIKRGGEGKVCEKIFLKRGGEGEGKKRFDPHRFKRRVGDHAAAKKALEESERFLTALEKEACQPPRVYEHSWEVGQLIVWDNLRFVHRVQPYTYDEGAEERELLNCRILGDPATDAGLRTAEAAPERSPPLEVLFFVERNECAETPNALYLL